jgi:predicted Zn-dependent protease with MMP-like domain
MDDEALLEEAWEAYGEGDFGRAIDLCARVGQWEPDRWLLELSIHTAGGEFAAAEAARERGRALGVEADPRWRMAEGELALQRWRLEEAEAAFRSLLRGEFGADACAALGEVLELEGRLAEADHMHQEAHRLDPERYPRPERMDERDFEQVVQEAIADLPADFQALLEESEVIVAPAPTRELVVPGLEAETPPDLLGLFCGASRIERAGESIGEEPSVIYLFQRNLERACADREELREEIRVTLYHELAHLLGFDEEGVDELGLA